MRPVEELKNKIEDTEDKLLLLERILKLEKEVKVLQFTVELVTEALRKDGWLL